MTGISWGTVALLLFVAGGILVVQPVLLGLSASIAGERPPRWLKGFVTLVLAAFGSGAAGLVYSVTLGLVLARFGQWPVTLGALAVSWLATSVVYSALLRIAIDRAALVAAIYWAFSGALLGGVALVLKLVLG